MFHNEKIAYFSELISCCQKLYLWELDHLFELLHSNCPEQEAVYAVLNMNIMKEQVLEYAAANDAPFILTGSLSMMWITAFEKTKGDLHRIYILGPFFMDDTSLNGVEDSLRKLHLSKTLREITSAFLHSLPIISLNRILEYSIMLHYSITGQKLHTWELGYLTSKVSAILPSVPDAVQEPVIHGTYEAEQEMLRMVREGDLSFEQHIEKISLMGSLGKLGSTPGRQFKNAVLVCITLFSRAAIEGGLSPELSMTLTDYYFQSVEACNTIPELAEVARTMQKDFVTRVHACRENATCSKTVQLCRNYINAHIEEHFTLSDLASKLGYADYYLSKKYKAETGMTLKQYTLQVRLERACFLLACTDLEINRISERLFFNSPSYFSNLFKKTYDQKPSEYREAHRHA